MSSDDAPLVDRLHRDGPGGPVELRLVPTWDGLYTPVALQLPDGGDRPHPLVTLAHGNGGGGLPWVRDVVERRHLVADRLLAAGYAVAWLDYRTEVELGYHLGGPLTRDVRAGGELLNRSPLEFEDQRAVIEHLAGRPDIDADLIGAIGVSHAGEMLLKLCSGWDGIAAAVAAEPAAHEFLALRRRDDEDVEHLDVAGADSVRRRIDLDVATARAAAITAPFLVLGRDGDPLQGVFRATADLLDQVGVDVTWASYDHPEHGYVLPERGDDGRYADRDGSLAAIAEVTAFLDRHLT